MEREKLKYRQKVNAIILDDQDRVLIVQPVFYKRNEWGTPGGGVEEGETSEETLVRELNEELGITELEILMKSKKVYRYEFSDELLKQKLDAGKMHRGQEMVQFVVKVKSIEQIVPDGAEIREYMFVDRDSLYKYLLFEGQNENIQAVLDEYFLEYREKIN